MGDQQLVDVVGIGENGRRQFVDLLVVGDPDDDGLSTVEHMHVIHP